MRRTTFTSLAVFALLWSSSSFAGDPLTLEVASAQRGHVQNNQIVLDIRLSENSGRLFGSWTGRHVGKTIDVSIDGRVIMKPRLLSQITGGVLQVLGPSADDINAWIPKLLDGRSVLSVDSED